MESNKRSITTPISERELLCLKVGNVQTGVAVHLLANFVVWGLGDSNTPIVPFGLLVDISLTDIFCTDPFKNNL